MPAIAMSPTLSPKEVFENYGLKPNHLAQLRYQKKGPRYIQATPRTVLYRQSDIEDWLTANTVETEDSKEMKKATWLNDHDAVTDESMTTIIPFNNIESIEQMDPVDAKDGDLK